MTFSEVQLMCAQSVAQSEPQGSHCQGTQRQLGFMATGRDPGTGKLSGRGWGDLGFKTTFLFS